MLAPTKTRSTTIDTSFAVALSLSFGDVDPTDVELYADRRFLRAGAFDPHATAIAIDGVDRVQTKARNHHRGVSVHDLLRSLSSDDDRKPAPATTKREERLDLAAEALWM